ncbi:MAG: phosphoribosylanthranilate isomerase [Planctomycetota bacterium]
MSDAGKEETPRRQDAETPSKTWIKICGFKDVDTALAAAEAGADFIGLNFVEASPRFVDYDVAKTIVEALPPAVQPIALVNHLDNRQQFDELRHATGGVTWLQLHGQEPPTLAASLHGFQLIRALPAEAAADQAILDAWASHTHVKAFLWDAPTSPDNPLGGGSGHTSDWDWLAERLPKSRPSLLAGGLTPDNVAEAIHKVRPWGVDVSSGVESSRGVKDIAKISDFCAAVQQADTNLNGI